MKKLIALIATVSVFVGMTATAFATTTPTVAENGAITKNADGSFTLNGAAVEMNVVNDVKEDIANNNQTTIVVVEGTEITTSSIQYINQDSKTSFTFIPKDDTTYKAGSKEVVLNAYIGGDGITKTAAGTITYAVDKVEYAVTFVYVNEENTLTTISSTTTTDGKVAQPADPTREGYTFDGWYTDASYTTAFDFTAALATNTTVYAKYTKEAAGGEDTEYTYDVALQNATYNNIAATVVRITGLDTSVVVTVDGIAAKYYTKTDGTLVHVACVPSTAAPAISVDDGTPELFVFGDVAGGGTVIAADVTDMRRRISGYERTKPTYLKYELPTDLMQLLVYDVDGSGTIAAADVTALRRAYSGYERTKPTYLKYTLDTMGCYTK